MEQNRGSKKTDEGKIGQGSKKKDKKNMKKNFGKPEDVVWRQKKKMLKDFKKTLKNLDMLSSGL